ncbi:MAG: 30S ribosomal protein S20 [Acidobacteria bacterium]|nr:MAG: 30S ribosomal protein S20 [Acidobacteriota bacterium]
MASHKSALKRIKQTGQRTERNRAHLTRLRHQIRKLRRALETKDKAGAEALLRPTLALIDHSSTQGVLHRNTASRYKSRLTRRFNQLTKV